MNPKFKKGDLVLSKTNLYKQYTVQNAEAFTHESFTHRYITLLGEDGIYSEDDFVKAGSLSALARVALNVCIWMFVSIAIVALLISIVFRIAIN